MPAMLLEKVCYAKFHDLLKNSDPNGRSKKMLIPSEIQLIKWSALIHIEFADVESSAFDSKTIFSEEHPKLGIVCFGWCPGH